MAAIGEVVFQKGEEDESDIWDDTALIKAYDEAVNLMKAKIAAEQGDDEHSTAQEQQKQKSKKSKKRHRNKKKDKANAQTDKPACNWKEGDHCRAVFRDDGQMYEGVITSINDDEEFCIVRYLGYGNEEEQKLSDLLPPPQQPASSPSQKRNDSRSERHSHHSGDEDSMDWRSGASPRPESVASSVRSRSSSQRKGPGFHSPRWPNPPHPLMGMPPPFPSFPFMPPMFPPMTSMPGWPGSSEMPGAMPHVPPPPPMPEDLPEDDTEALHSMLIAWYMSGYHTGYFQGLKAAKKKAKNSSGEKDGQRKA